MERVVPWKELEEVVSRHLLEEHKLQEKLMRRVTRMFSEKGIMTKNGTIVDATIILNSAVAGLKMAHLLKITLAFEFSVLTLTVPGLGLQKVQNPASF